MLLCAWMKLLIISSSEALLPDNGCEACASCIYYAVDRSLGYVTEGVMADFRLGTLSEQLPCAGDVTHVLASSYASACAECGITPIPQLANCIPNTRYASAPPQPGVSSSLVLPEHHMYLTHSVNICLQAAMHSCSICRRIVSDSLSA